MTEHRPRAGGRRGGGLLAQMCFICLGLLAISSEAAQTPVPYWICPCMASLWREFHDSQQVTTTINMAVSLPYSKQTFTEDMKTRFRTSVASAADVPLFRVIINSINEVQTPNRRLLTVAIDVDFIIHVSLEVPEPIRTALTMNTLNVHLSTQGVLLISAVAKLPKYEEYMVNLMIEFASTEGIKGNLIPPTKSRESNTF